MISRLSRAAPGISRPARANSVAIIPVGSPRERCNEALRWLAARNPITTRANLSGTKLGGLETAELFHFWKSSAKTRICRALLRTLWLMETGELSLNRNNQSQYELIGR